MGLEPNRAIRFGRSLPTDPVRREMCRPRFPKIHSAVTFSTSPLTPAGAVADVVRWPDALGKLLTSAVRPELVEACPEPAEGGERKMPYVSGDSSVHGSTGLS